MAQRILVSAGEVSGDRYAAMLVDELRELWRNPYTQELVTARQTIHV
jgi:lipid A disaccharide synthetase